MLHHPFLVLQHERRHLRELTLLARVLHERARHVNGGGEKLTPPAVVHRVIRVLALYHGRGSTPERARNQNLRGGEQRRPEHGVQPLSRLGGEKTTQWRGDARAFASSHGSEKIVARVSMAEKARGWPRITTNGRSLGPHPVDEFGSEMTKEA